MAKKFRWLFCWAAAVLVVEAFPQSPRDPSSFRPVDERLVRFRTPGARWTGIPLEDSHRQASRGVSHGLSSHPYESTLRWTYESSTEHPGYYSSLEEHWRPSSVELNSTGVDYYGYSRARLSQYASDAAKPVYPALKQGIYAVYQFPQTPPAAGGQGVVRKVPAYYSKVDHQVQSFDAFGNSKYVKNTSHQSSAGHKKTAYPRVHKPYVKHKYPTRKTVHPLYKRFYQSQYQRYAIPSAEMLRYKIKPQGGGHHKTSTAPPATTSDGRQTTERMDDVYPEESSASGDYTAYGDAGQKNHRNYYEIDEEVDKNGSESEESSYDETATRGYYGDRIYMSTQTPLVTSEKTAVKNKYFIVRRTSDDEDIETIFE